MLASEISFEYPFAYCSDIRGAFLSLERGGLAECAFRGEDALNRVAPRCGGKAMRREGIAGVITERYFKLGCCLTKSRQPADDMPVSSTLQA